MIYVCKNNLLISKSLLMMNVYRIIKKYNKINNFFKKINIKNRKIAKIHLF